jgi:phage pi2 protein 07
MKVGDLVDIYYQQYDPTKCWIDKAGIIVDIVGYKTTVLIDGKLDGWDMSDLKKMTARKQQEARGD